ncbi:MAG: hypothetical protein NVS3B7_01410 [Candidatus Elarobacter sp.]
MAQDMSQESSSACTSLDDIRAKRAGTKLSASTLNFIVWIDDPDRREWVLERAAKLSEKHPSFTLILDHTGARHGDATVTSTAHESGSRDAHSPHTVQGECVQIDVSNAGTPAIAGYVTDLCPSSIQTVLWWSGMCEASRPIFEELLPLVHTLVVDASASRADDSAIRLVAEFHSSHPNVRLRDLAWLRLRPWQDMIANFFDDPNLLSELFSIRRLHIESGSEAEAFYLAGWLASRLDWRASGRDAFADRDGNVIRFERVRDGEIRRVQSVCLDSEASWYHGEVSHDDPQVVTVWVEGDHAREPRLFPLQAIDNASLLERAILETGTDEVFERALRSVATLLG